MKITFSKIIPMTLITLATFAACRKDPLSPQALSRSSVDSTKHNDTVILTSEFTKQLEQLTTKHGDIAGKNKENKKSKDKESKFIKVEKYIYSKEPNSRLVYVKTKDGDDILVAKKLTENSFRKNEIDSGRVKVSIYSIKNEPIKLGDKKFDKIILEVKKKRANFINIVGAKDRQQLKLSK